jgi:hypothetical protein
MQVRGHNVFTVAFTLPLYSAAPISNAAFASGAQISTPTRPALALSAGCRLSCSSTVERAGQGHKQARAIGLAHARQYYSGVACEVELCATTLPPPPHQNSGGVVEC